MAIQPLVATPDAGQRLFPDPERPGQYVNAVAFDELAAYKARWASSPRTRELVIAGRYDELTPVVCEFIPTLNCCFRCGRCHFKDDKVKLGIWTCRHRNPLFDMPLRKAKKYLRELRACGVEALMITGGGEPTDHPDIVAMLLYARELGFRLAMTTNGTFLQLPVERIPEIGFDLMRISLNTSLRHHACFHGYDPRLGYGELVHANIRKILKAKGTTRLQLCAMFGEEDISELSQLGKEIAEFPPGIDSVVIRPALEYSTGSEIRDEALEQALRVIEDDLIPRLESVGIAVYMPKVRFVDSRCPRTYRKCLASGLIGQVWWDGSLYPCTETNGRDEFRIGNLDDGLDTVYRSERCMQVKQMAEDSCFKICPSTCRPNPLNVLFEEIERVRMERGTAVIRDWVNALGAQYSETNPFIGF